MYLKSLHIENFRRFERFECEFHERLTLLMGVNGSGKSSLLRAISLPVKEALPPLNRNRAPSNFELSDVRTTYSADPSDEVWASHQFPSVLTLKLALEQETVTLPLERTALAREWSYPEEDGPSPSYDLDKLQSRVNGLFSQSNKVAIPLIAHIGVGEIESGSIHADLTRPFEQKRQLWDQFYEGRIDAYLLTQWFQHYEFRALQEGQEPLIFRATKQAVLNAIQAIDIKFVVRESRLMVRYDASWHPFDQLSDGQKRIAALFLEIAIRAASLNSHLGERCLLDAPGFVLIDELDMHLHPQWQRSVIDNLLDTFPKLQFVVASHSPFLIQSALDRGIVLNAETGERMDAMDHSIEDIAETMMGVDQPHRSKRFLEKRQLAQEYLELMESPTSTAEEREALKLQLDGALAEFADDPAAAAWLKMQSLSKGL